MGGSATSASKLPGRGVMSKIYSKIGTPPVSDGGDHLTWTFHHMLEHYGTQHRTWLRKMDVMLLEKPHFFLRILQVPKASATSAVYCAQDYQKYTMAVWQWVTCHSNWQWFLPLRRSNVWIRISSHYTCTWRRLYLQGSASSVHQYRCWWSTRCIRQSRKHSYLWWQWPRRRCKGWHSDRNHPKSERVW